MNGIDLYGEPLCEKVLVINTLFSRLQWRKNQVTNRNDETTWTRIEGVEVRLHSFLKTVDGDVWSSSRSGRFASVKISQYCGPAVVREQPVEEHF